jgi:hypothetical protein
MNIVVFYGLVLVMLGLSIANFSKLKEAYHRYFNWCLRSGGLGLATFCLSAAIFVILFAWPLG